MAKPEKLESKLEVLRLWFHENCRVFQDRLVNDEDRKWFISLMREKMTTGFDVVYEDVVDKIPLVYGDFMIPNAENKIYAEVTDYSKVSGKLKYDISAVMFMTWTTDSSLQRQVTLR